MYISTIASEKGYSEEEQTQFLVRLERACVDNPDLPPTFVANCLMPLSESKLHESFPFAPRNTGIQA
ncbi:hypothetical protein [Polynucleobacter asymbioticus]|uniref:hypothetical protein n=1 Tax=Polynucleobacter asymbioticus TaxID=576611 RepID=UPI0008F8E90A|nr:hypothetical protein [Polynucleobacter asymbioticus]